MKSNTIMGRTCRTRITQTWSIDDGSKRGDVLLTDQDTDPFWWISHQVRELLRHQAQDYLIGTEEERRRTWSADKVMVMDVRTTTRSS